MSTLRKRRLSQPTEPDDDSAPLNLASVATIDYSSEDPAHPVEHLVDEHTGPGGSCWAAAQADTTEQLILVFDQPQSVLNRSRRRPITSRTLCGTSVAPTEVA